MRIKDSARKGQDNPDETFLCRFYLIFSHRRMPILLLSIERIILSFGTGSPPHPPPGSVSIIVLNRSAAIQLQYVWHDGCNKTFVRFWNLSARVISWGGGVLQDVLRRNTYIEDRIKPDSLTVFSASL